MPPIRDIELAVGRALAKRLPLLAQDPAPTKLWVDRLRRATDTQPR